MKQTTTMRTVIACMLLTLLMITAAPVMAATEYTVYFNNSNNWKNCYIHVWGQKNTGNFPGGKFVDNGTVVTTVKNNSGTADFCTCSTEVIAGKTYYKLVFENENDQFIISGGSDSTKSGGGNLSCTNGAVYDATGKIHDNVSELTSTGGGGSGGSTYNNQIYFYNDKGWDDVYLFTWNSSNCGAYPGAQIIKNGEPVAEFFKKDSTTDKAGTCEVVNTADGKYYVINFNYGGNGMIISNGGSNNEDKAGGGDLTVSNNAVYTAEGGQKYDNLSSFLTELKEANGGGGGGSGSGNYIYVADEGEWAQRLNPPKMYAYFWTSSANNGWPGAEMTLYPTMEYDGHTGIYCIEVPDEYNEGSIIINSNNKCYQYPESGSCKIQNKSVFFVTSKTYEEKYDDGTLKKFYKLGEDPIYLDSPLTLPGAPEPEPIPMPENVKTSGTLPVLYISVYDDEAHTRYNGDMLNRNYVDKEEHKNALYYIDVPEGVNFDWAQELGSAEEPLALSIKLRGNFTRTGYSKKPYKLKLGVKQSMLGLSESKHFALLAHADDDKGYMRNFVGFELGKLIGLPWTPSQQPVEVVINGEYRGLYFLTESIRIEKKRVNIIEGSENETEKDNITGGYLVELDNYDEDLSIQYRTTEQSCSGKKTDMLRVTYDTPEKLSDFQKDFIKYEIDEINTLVGKANTSEGDRLWSYLDLDDAVRYYIVEELIGHWEAYHGSTYLFRDRGADQKWHFSPLWDCGHAFESGAESQYIWDHNGSYGCTWISSMNLNSMFKAKLKKTWQWFMQDEYPKLEAKIDSYRDALSGAVQAEYDCWHGKPKPDGHNSEQAFNTDINSKAEYVKKFLENKASWLSGEWGAYDDNNDYVEPARDTTAAAELPERFRPTVVEPDPTPEQDPSEEPAGNYVYVANDGNWSTPMKAYIYDGESKKENAAWPGVTMTYCSGLTYNGKTGLYAIAVSEELKNGQVIISGGDKRYPGDMKPGVEIKGKSVLLTTNSEQNNTTSSELANPLAGTAAALGITPTPTPGSGELIEDRTDAWIYVSDEGNWGSLNAYFYIDGGGEYAKWPGTVMTKYESMTYDGHTGIYAIEVPSEYLQGNVLINGGGKQYPASGGISIGGKSVFFVTNSSANSTSNEQLAHPIVGTPATTQPVLPPVGEAKPSGTLPVLYINVYDDDAHTIVNNDLTNRNYIEKEVHDKATYYLEVPEGVNFSWAKPIASADSPLPLEIKLRGNYTRTGFSKKPYKLKLGTKQSMLGLSKSKHFALLTHADDSFGYLRNFVGFELGKLIGLPWTPSQQPVEVVINGDYRGLYFLTESIRIEEKRVNITEGAEEDTSEDNFSGGYLVELDNYEEDSSIQYSAAEKACPGGSAKGDMKLLVTYDTPEKLSPIQKSFIKHEFDKMNEGVGKVNSSDELWSYMDLDDAVRYYIVMELLGHYEAYHGSTYLFRDRGADQKWHFSPLWDCGHAFETENQYLWENEKSFGNTWISSMNLNKKFQDKRNATWKWFMTHGYTNLMDAIDVYVASVEGAVNSEYARWKDEPLPTEPQGKDKSAIQFNTDMATKTKTVKDYLERRANWLSGKWGSYASGTFEEPERDNTAAAELPDFSGIDFNPKKVYVYDGGNWTSDAGHPALYCYMHGNGTNGEWPGEKMTYDANIIYKNGNTTYKGLWVYEMPYELNNAKLIVNWGDNGKQYPSSDGMQPGGKDVFFNTGSTGSGLTKLDPVKDYISYPWSETLPVLMVTTNDGSEVQRDKVSATWMMLDKSGKEVTPNGNSKVKIKGRGTSTWTDFDKKPYKIEFDKKQTLCGMTASKHFVLLPYLTQRRGEEGASSVIMENLAGYELSRRIGMTWTPEQEPIELVLNGKYVGLYYMCENVRPSVNRVPVGDYSDWNDMTADIIYDIEKDWLIEIDNEMEDASAADYNWEDLSLQVAKSYNVVASNPELTDKDVIKNGHQEQLRATLASELESLIAAAESATEKNEGEKMSFAVEWENVIDCGEASKYFILQELMDDWRGYDTNFFLWRTPEEGASAGLWMLGPVWDFSGAFAYATVERGAKEGVRHGKTSSSAIVNKLADNIWFHDRAACTFFRFIGSDKAEVFDKVGYDRAPRRAESAEATENTDKMEDLAAYLQQKAAEIEPALKKDAEVWPQYATAYSNMAAQAAGVATNLQGTRSALEAYYADAGLTTSLGAISESSTEPETEIYDISGRRVSKAQAGGIYIIRKGTKSRKVLVK